MPLTIEVLLATYNGAAFVREQIESVLAQSYAAAKVLARDDGSNDGTEAILAEYAERFPERFRVVVDGVRTGSAQGNFDRLLRASSAPYVAFCDQDDVWLPRKLELSMVAMQTLEAGRGRGKGCLVFTDVRVVDQELKELQPSFWAVHHVRPELAQSFRQLVMQNVVTGSTMLINRALVTLVGDVPAASAMHDWWFALAASAMGEIGIVREATVLYRQHASNVLGAAMPVKKTRLPRFRKHEERRRYWGIVMPQVRAFLDKYRTVLPGRCRRILERYLRANRSESAVVRVVSLLQNWYFGGSLRVTAAIYMYVLDGWTGPVDE